MSRLLSDKAKGKQRAVELTPLPATSRDLVVRFTDGIPDLAFRLEQQHTVRDLKAQIRAARPQLVLRRLKLIHAGRLLTDSTALFAWLDSLEQRQRRAAAKDPTPSASDVDEAPLPAPAPLAAPQTVYLHCSVGAEFAEGESEEEEHQTTQIKPLRGLDRLASAGFSEADIANFRRQFHSHASAEYLTTAEFATDEEYEEHARSLEEQWIESMDGAASLGGAAPDTVTILQGVLLGFFFPILPLFFFNAPKLPVFWSTGNGGALEDLGSVVFSRRMQMGVVVGFMVNMLLGLWRYLWGSL